MLYSHCQETTNKHNYGSSDATTTTSTTTTQLQQQSLISRLANILVIASILFLTVFPRSFSVDND